MRDYDEIKSLPPFEHPTFFDKQVKLDKALQEYIDWSDKENMSMSEAKAWAILFVTTHGHLID